MATEMAASDFLVSGLADGIGGGVLGLCFLLRWLVWAASLPRTLALGVAEWLGPCMESCFAIALFPQ